MRMIGHLENEAHARLFSDYLYAQGVDNEVEPDRDGTWAVWVHAEEELDHASKQLRLFQQNPGEAKYQHAQDLAQDRREQERRQDEAAQKRYFDRNTFVARRFRGMGTVTLVLVALSVLFSLLFWARVDLSWLRISEYDVVRGGPAARLEYGLPEIRHGQFWRLFTPILLHAGILHLLFNMLWLKDLGSMFELSLHRRRYIVFVLVISGLSNLGQFILSGPNFVGMSGVVYGLLGYIWMRGRFDPRSGLFVDRNTMLFMTIWFFACLLGIIPNVANTVHTVGFVGGLSWGYLDAMRSNAR